jgi:hypothetical protein
MSGIRAPRRRLVRELGCIRRTSCGADPTAALNSNPGETGALA